MVGAANRLVSDIASGQQPGKFEVVIVNDKVETAYDELRAALLSDIEKAQKRQG